MLKTFWFVFSMEMRLLFRRSQEWLYPLAFFVIVVSLFPLAFTPDPLFLQKYVPGGIWIAALLASLLSVSNFFYSDLEDNCLEQFVLCNTSLTLIISAKLCALWVAMQLPLILLTPLLGILFQLSVTSTGMLLLSLLLGTPILTLIGSLCVTLTLGLRQQGVILGLLILPLVTPILIFGVSIVQQAEAGIAIAGLVALLAGICVLVITLLPWTIAAAVRIGLDE